MPKYICKTNVDGVDYYFEWSTVVDAPVSYGMVRSEFEAYYEERYGTQTTEKYASDNLSELDRRLLRVDSNGTSSLEGMSLEELIEGNRAGEGETELPLSGIVKLLLNKEV